MDPWYKVATPRKEVRGGRSSNPDEFAIAGELHDESLRLIQSNWRFPLPPFLVSRIRPSDSTNCISSSAVKDCATTSGPGPRKASQMRVCNTTKEIDPYSRPERITNGLAYS